jgi:hypothetical protein
MDFPAKVNVEFTEMAIFVSILAVQFGEWQMAGRSAVAIAFTAT